MLNQGDDMVHAVIDPLSSDGSDARLLLSAQLNVRYWLSVAPYISGLMFAALMMGHHLSISAV